MARIVQKHQIATRPPVKQRLILRDLRRDIVSGRLTPGGRLPPRTELEQRFQVSAATLQRALDKMAADGFVYARGPKGTFVTDHPPHLAHHALVYPHRPTDTRNWTRFWTAIANEALRVEDGSGLRFPSYYVDTPDHDDYGRLLRHVHASRLAGLIFAMSPIHLMETPLVVEPGIPRVAIVSELVPQQMAVVQLDNQSFIDKSLDYLRSKGCRRIGVVTTPGHVPSYYTAWMKSAADRELELSPAWMQAVVRNYPEWARNCVHGLLARPESERPDGIVITDDNLVEHAAAGVVTAGVGVPELVAHCNFPWPTPSVLPMRRLGYDAADVLSRCIKSIDLQRRGEAAPMIDKVSAVFEEELAGAA